MYEPKLGRFTSADTIKPDLTDPQQLNRYSYCLNNPLKYVDPSGHTPVLALWAITWMNAVLSSPDLQQDFQQLSLDASQGNMAGVGIDLAAAAIPGVSATMMKGAGKAVEAAKLSENIAATFRGGEYKTKILASAQKAYRIFGGKSTLEGASEGIFLAGSEYKTSRNAKKFLALPDSNEANRISEVLIPKGKEVQYGKAEALFGKRGDGNQIYIRDKSGLTFAKPKDLK